MEKEKLVLKHEKKKKGILRKLHHFFSDKKKRLFHLFLIILPFLVAIGIFSYIAYREAKNVLNLAKGTSEVKEENIISSMGYSLRDNATDVQKEYFKELKEAVESGTVDDATIAGLVCKNYIVDFYTWTNKQGQYDIGGMYYVYSHSNLKIDYKKNTYVKARDGIYKYLNDYINQYGSSDLLEVQEVEIVSSSKSAEQYNVEELLDVVDMGDLGNNYIYGDVAYSDVYEVHCRWSYKETQSFNTSKYDKDMYFIVIKRNGRFEITEVSKSKIDLKKAENVEEQEEDAEQD